MRFFTIIFTCMFVMLLVLAVKGSYVKGELDGYDRGYARCRQLYRSAP